MASQVALGGRARVAIHGRPLRPGEPPAWERDFLVVEEHLPAGTTLIEGSVSHGRIYTLADGVLTFYFAPESWPASSSYEVYGYLPGRYRTLPARSAAPTSRANPTSAPPGDLRVRARASRTPTRTSPRPTSSTPAARPHFDAGRLADAADPLETLFAGYTLRDDIAKDAAADAPDVNIREYDPRKVVQYFEVVKEKAPELVLTFDQLLASAGRTATSTSSSAPPRLARGRRGELPGGRPRRRGAPPTRQDAGGDCVPARPLARVSRHGVDRERLLRPLAGPGPARRQGVHRPALAASWRRRG